VPDVVDEGDRLLVVAEQSLRGRGALLEVDVAQGAGVDGIGQQRAELLLGQAELGAPSRLPPGGRGELEDPMSKATARTIVALRSTGTLRASPESGRSGRSRRASVFELHGGNAHPRSTDAAWATMGVDGTVNPAEEWCRSARNSSTKATSIGTAQN
jgi:hypothetical protein